MCECDKSGTVSEWLRSYCGIGDSVPGMVPGSKSLSRSLSARSPTPIGSARITATELSVVNLSGSASSSVTACGICVDATHDVREHVEHVGTNATSITSIPIIYSYIYIIIPKRELVWYGGPATCRLQRYSFPTKCAPCPFGWPAILHAVRASRANGAHTDET